MRRWPGHIGRMSRKARTCGVERIKKQLGSTRFGSGFDGIGLSEGWYAAPIRQKGQVVGY